MRIGWVAVAVGVNAAMALPWWAGLWAVPEWRRWFVPGGVPDGALLSFAAGDLVLFSGAGVVAAIGMWRKASWTRPVLWVHTGAACYAALYVVQQWVMSGEAWVAAAAMFPSLLLLPFACRRMERER